MIPLLYHLSYTGSGSDDSVTGCGCPDQPSTSRDIDVRNPTSGPRNPLTAMLSLLWPDRCRLCPQAPLPASALCRQCQNQLPPLSPHCNRCLQRPGPLSSSCCGRCSGCRHAVPLRPFLHISGHQGSLRELVLLGKRGHRDDVARLLAQTLGHLIRQRHARVTERSPTMVAIPRHWSRRCSHGIPFSRRLAIPLARELGIRCHDLLARRWGPSQVSLPPHRRRGLASSVFQIGGAIAGSKPRRVILVDDVYTTGATLRAATSVLEAHEIKVLLWVTATVSTASSTAFPGPDSMTSRRSAAQQRLANDQTQATR